MALIAGEEDVKQEYTTKLEMWLKTVRDATECGTGNVSS